MGGMNGSPGAIAGAEAAAEEVEQAALWKA